MFPEKSIDVALKGTFSYEKQVDVKRKSTSCQQQKLDATQKGIHADWHCTKGSISFS